MSIVNFSISAPLEQKINQSIQKHGFASKAEFFRFLAFNFINKKDEFKLNEDEEFKKVTKKLAQTIHKMYGGKKLRSIEEQFSDLY